MFQVQEGYSALKLKLVGGGDPPIDVQIQKGHCETNWATHHIGPCTTLSMHRTGPHMKLVTNGGGDPRINAYGPKVTVHQIRPHIKLGHALNWVTHIDLEIPTSHLCVILTLDDICNISVS